jgi:hypothetical protein
MSDTKQQALDLFEEKRKEALADCRWIAKRIAQQNNGYCNIDLVREQHKCPDGVNPKFYGAVFNSAEWVHSGYKITSRKTSHGRPVSVWYWKEYKPATRKQMDVAGNLTLNF